LGFRIKLKALVSSHKISQATCKVHAVLNALRNSLMPPSKQRCQKCRGSCTMGAKNANIGGGKVRSTEAHGCVGFLGVFEQDKRRLFGLKKPFVRRYRDRVCRLDAGK
jgi:hypothetical protein